MDLRTWQNRFETCVEKFEPTREKMKQNRKQYEGTLQPAKGKDTSCIFNFTKELIESAIDSTVPTPKVEPVVKTERNKELARNIEAMLMNEIKRIGFDPLNDIDERTSKIMGGDIALVEWNNNKRTHDQVGDIDIRLISPLRFTPQVGIYELARMDYFFLDFEDTKANIKKIYGIDVDDESTDLERTEESDTEDTVTQKWAFYKNSQGNLGVFSWVNDTVIIDDEEYQARAEEVCTKCGASKPVGEDTCSCGNKHWQMRHLKYETLDEDLVRSDGTIIPREDYVRDDYGNFKMGMFEAPLTEIDPQTGVELPVYQQIFDDRMNVIGEQPVTIMEERAYKEPTQIPYYVPKHYPVALRKNISSQDTVFGNSDVEMITEQQLKCNQVLTRLINKTEHNGQLLTKLKSTNLTFNNGVQVLEIGSVDELAAIKNLDLRFDVNSDINLANQLYYWAKSLLGINDTSQGKQDATATSGVAKEAQISRAQARQSSKVVMKNVFYQDIYYSMFEYALAYMDEPRSYSYQNDAGDDEEKIFNRYDFLEQGKDGKWYYNDQFIITIDQMAGVTEDRQSVLELMQNDFSAGLYGNIQDPETILTFWKDRESMNYPNAKRQVARWQKKVEEYKQQQELLAQQALMLQSGGQNELPNM